MSFPQTRNLRLACVFSNSQTCSAMMAQQVAAQQVAQERGRGQVRFGSGSPSGVLQVQAQRLGKVVMRWGHIPQKRVQVKIVEQSFGNGCLSIRNAVRLRNLKALVQIVLLYPAVFFPTPHQRRTSSILLSQPVQALLENIVRILELR